MAIERKLLVFFTTNNSLKTIIGGFLRLSQKQLARISQIIVAYNISNPGISGKFPFAALDISVSLTSLALSKALFKAIIK